MPSTMTDRPVIIACAGRSSRFGGKFPKHIQTIRGEPNLSRTVRLLRERGENRIIVTANAENHIHFRDLGAQIIVGSAEREIDRYRNTYDILEPDTVILYGDVVYDSHDLDQVLGMRPRRNIFFGRLGGNPRTRKQYGEIFGVVVRDPDKFRKDTDRVAHLYEIGELKRELGWEVYKQSEGMINQREGVKDSPGFHSVGDLTDDFDTPEHLELLRILHEEEQHD